MAVHERGKQVARASAILTSGYVAGNELACESFRRVALFITLTRHASASSNTAAIKVEFSPDNGTTYFQMGALQVGAITGGSSLTALLQTAEASFNDEASGANRVVWDLDTLGATHIKVSAKETQDTTNLGTLAIDAYFRD